MSNYRDIFTQKSMISAKLLERPFDKLAISCAYTPSLQWVKPGTARDERVFETKCSIARAPASSPRRMSRKPLGYSWPA